MSRSKKQPYTGSKRFDSSCRNHGSCAYCRHRRTFRDARRRAQAEQDLREYRHAI